MSCTHKLVRYLVHARIGILGIVLLACNDAVEPSPSATSNIDTQAQSLSVTGAAFPNEPAGYTQISDRAFDRKVESGWKDRGDPEFSLITDSKAPESPNNVGKAFFRNGWKGGTGPIDTWFVFKKPKRNLYLSTWVKFSSNWRGHPSGANKILVFRIGGSPRVILKATGAAGAALIANIKLQSVNASPVSFDLDPNLGAMGGLKRGQWHRIEVLLQANTGGSSNGGVTWWVDGVLVGKYSNVNFVKASLNNTWEEVAWNPIWGGAGGILDRNQDMQIDHIYMSGS